MHAERFHRLFDEMPLVAILRGIAPETSRMIDAALTGAGVKLLEVPLNSPQALTTIADFAARAGEAAMAGAGTVLDPDMVDKIAAARGTLIVSPNFNEAVVRRARARGLVALPGVATPSEAFAALAAGADALKLFPAEMIPPAAVKAMRAVLPREARLIIVGGVTPQSMRDYLAAGANGFGIGGSLYKPGDSAESVGRKAGEFVAACRAARDAVAQK